MSERSGAASDNDRQRILRRAAAARALVARLAPELLNEPGVDRTLHDGTLSRDVLGRLDDAYRQCREEDWLRGLRRADPSDRR
jgi:hypothetical protein